MNLKARIRQHFVQAAVLETAVQNEVDAWTELKWIVLRIENNDFNDGDRRKLKQCYKHCYSHLIALTKVISTTTADAHCGPLRKNFASGQYGQDSKGVIVIADEAGKDVGVNIFTAAFEQAWHGKVSGLTCLSDEEQLKPTNTCSFGPR
ncbi:hypothetical protein KC315_g12884 [Hortaea werneckii]|nr:hypothetical protein KC315_g12884 [Hortaea werneckii]KAI7360426.1 hypothetical protein KC354_g8875 [Hortaea werneckii]